MHHAVRCRLWLLDIGYFAKISCMQWNLANAQCRKYGCPCSENCRNDSLEVNAYNKAILHSYVSEGDVYCYFSVPQELVDAGKCCGRKAMRSVRIIPTRTRFQVSRSTRLAGGWLLIFMMYSTLLYTARQACFTSLFKTRLLTNCRFGSEVQRT